MTLPSRSLRIAAATREAPARDGRRRRSQDSRARIVAALLELVQAGQVAPSAEQVAARADVGLRTVFRHFADMDSLYREMQGVIEAEMVRTVVGKPLKASEWREQVLELVGRRAAVYEKIAPFKQAAGILRHDSPFLQAGHTRFAALCRQIVKAILPADIAADRALLETLDLMLSFEAWSRLRNEQGLSRRRAEAALEATLRKLLD